MDAEQYEARQKKICQELAGIEEKRTDCKRLKREVDQMAEEMYYQNQQDGYFLEELSYYWADDPEMAALVAASTESCNRFRGDSHAFAAESDQAFRDVLVKLRWEEEECHEQQRVARQAFNDSQGLPLDHYPKGSL